MTFLLAMACAPVAAITSTSTPQATPFDLPNLMATPKFDTPTPIIVPPTPTPGELVYIVQSGDILSEIAKQFGVPVEYLAQENGIKDPDRIYVNQVLVIPKWPPDPPTPDTNEKEIIVVLSTQTVCAAENGKIIKCVLASTGLTYPTPVGHFKVYAKVDSLHMVGPGYDLPNVPWNLCFLPKGLGYCIHGTYWHHNFGHPMSHGCVNLSIEDAKWFYDWGEIGTIVWVKE
jgi:lipoprotein-anchoring transpeptidase ErfK/SrfK